MFPFTAGSEDYGSKVKNYENAEVSPMYGWLPHRIRTLLNTVFRNIITYTSPYTFSSSTSPLSSLLHLYKNNPSKKLQLPKTTEPFIRFFCIIRILSQPQIYGYTDIFYF